MLDKIIQLFSNEPDEDLVMAYQYKIPSSINVDIDKQDGYYIARVERINNQPLDTSTFLTEAQSVVELVAEVNDMLFDYLGFPDNIKSRMPRLLPPVEFLEKEGALLQSGDSKELVFAK
jgi:hypothetical protein